MARDGSGSHNEPTFLGTGGMATAADFNDIVAWAKTLANGRVGTAAARAALTGSDLWDGLAFFETDTSRLYYRVSSAWVLWMSGWESYTPTGTNISGGTLTAKFRRLGKTRDVVIRHVSPTVTGSVSYTLPEAAADTDLHEAGFVTFYDASVPTENKGWVRLSTNAILTAANSASTYLAITNLSSSIPFTWATNDFLEARFSYEVA